jgi:hypothetical protein
LTVTGLTISQPFQVPGAELQLRRGRETWKKDSQ